MKPEPSELTALGLNGAYYRISDERANKEFTEYREIKKSLDLIENSENREYREIS